MFVQQALQPKLPQGRYDNVW